MIYLIGWFLCGLIGVFAMIGLDKFLIKDNALLYNLVTMAFIFLVGPAGALGVIIAYLLVSLGKKLGG